MSLGVVGIGCVVYLALRGHLVFICHAGEDERKDVPKNFYIWKKAQVKPFARFLSPIFLILNYRIGLLYLTCFPEVLLKEGEDLFDGWLDCLRLVVQHIV